MEKMFKEFKHANSCLNIKVVFKKNVFILYLTQFSLLPSVPFHFLYTKFSLLPLFILFLVHRIQCIERQHTFKYEKFTFKIQHFPKNSRFILAERKFSKKSKSIYCGILVDSPRGFESIKSTKTWNFSNCLYSFDRSLCL